MITLNKVFEWKGTPPFTDTVNTSGVQQSEKKMLAMQL